MRVNYVNMPYVNIYIILITNLLRMFSFQVNYHNIHPHTNITHLLHIGAEVFIAFQIIKKNVQRNKLKYI